MWANEDISEAKNVLLSAQNIEQVTTDQSRYIVIDESTLTDELYLQALDNLVESQAVELVENTGERRIYRKKTMSS